MFAHVDVILLSGAEVRSSTHHCAKDQIVPPYLVVDDSLVAFPFGVTPLKNMPLKLNA
jgi:hypothetical protein